MIQALMDKSYQGSLGLPEVVAISLLGKATAASA